MIITIEIDGLEVTAHTYDESEEYLPGFQITDANILVQGRELKVLESLEANQNVYSLVITELEREYEKLTRD